MKLNKKQKEFLAFKQEILNNTKQEIRNIIITAIKINNNISDKKKINLLFEKYLIK